MNSQARRSQRHHFDQSQTRAISIAATNAPGRGVGHPRLAVAVMLAIQLAFTLLFLLAGMS